jgi:MscS family membrane protein
MTMIEKFKDYLPFLHETDAWILQVFAIIFIALLLDYVQKKILRRLQKQLEKTPNLWDDAFIHAVIKPLSILIWMFGLSGAIEVAGLSNALKVFEVGMIITVGWTLIRLISFVEVNVIKQQKIKGKGCY